jgi:hypothetical protein
MTLAMLMASESGRVQYVDAMIAFGQQQSIVIARWRSDL